MAKDLNQLAPITADDETLRKALKEAHIPSLMAALVHITGDLNIIRGPIRPVNDFFGDAQGGINEAQQAEIRELAFNALRRYRDGGQRMPASPPESLVHEMVNFVIGTEVGPDYAEFLTSELAMDNRDSYAAPGLDQVPAKARANFKVVIIGSGMSGLLAGIRLQQAGIPFTIVERHANVGGTWYQNTYPGCRVDSPNHTYSYSFKPNDWPQYYSKQEVLRKYFDEVATEYGLREHIRFNTTVIGAQLRRRRARSGTSRSSRKDGKRGDARGERRDHRRRPAEPAEVAGHPGPRPLQGRLVPLHRVGAPARPDRQEDHRARHGRERVPVRAGDRARSPRT